MKTIIVAAGPGIRLWDTTERIPKTLLPFNDGTVLSQILGNFASIGIEDFVIVVGYRPEMIVGYLESVKFFGHRVTIVENPEWKRGNGVSVFSAASAVPEDEDVFLSMSDHLMPPEALRRIHSAKSERNLLLTDPKLDTIFDIDDATKVVVEDARIVQIGKSLTRFNAVDCGVFRLNRRFFQALERQIAAGNESISDGARLLIENDDFESISIPGDCRWIDIDTPEAYRHALGVAEQLNPAAARAGSTPATDPTP
jgi:choline kinase